MPDGAQERELLERHLPVLRYDSQGSFMADSCAVLTDRVANDGAVASCLKRADGTLIASAAPKPPLAKLELGFLCAPAYGDGTPGSRSDLLDAVGRDYVLQAREMHRPPLADRVYGHAVRAADEGWWLQYWFFYLYNNKAFLGFGLHEGDWEMVQVRLGPDSAPQAMAFAQHSHGQRCRWELVEKRAQRPVVYVARGSQASYSFPGRHKAPIVPDHADGKGPEVADPALELISDAEPAWVAWPGRWGSSKARNAAESNSPRGPAHQDKWSDPETFHDECDEIEPRRLARAPAPQAPQRPEITARREGDHAVISYRITASRAHPQPVQLVLTLDSPQDGLPPATYARVVEAASGDIEHPLPLEEGRYTVLVSAADREGNSSDVAVSELE